MIKREINSHGGGGLCSQRNLVIGFPVPLTTVVVSAVVIFTSSIMLSTINYSLCTRLINSFLSSSTTPSTTCVDLPQHDPLITGLTDNYEDGDLVSVNCTTALSSPPASITWYVNGLRMNSDYPNLLHEEHFESNAFHLQARSLELHFHLDRFQHFREDRNTVELRCSAQVDGMPVIPPRETIKFMAMRQATLTNHPLMTYLAESGGGASRNQLDNLRLVLPSVVFVVVLVRRIFQSTQLS